MTHRSLVVLVALLGSVSVGVGPAPAQCMEWAEQSIANPPPSIHHSLPMQLVYDEARHVTIGVMGDHPQITDRVVLFRFAAGNWSQINPSGPSPAARTRYLTCYHKQRGTVLLFAGKLVGGQKPEVNDLWEWNGTSWTQIVHPGLWPPADPETMVYDPIRNRVIVIDAQTYPSTLCDTWEWTGSAWEQGAVFGPASPDAMCFDSFRNVGFVHGYWGGWNTVWEYTPGATAAQGVWNQVAMSQTSGAHEEAALVYDPYRRRVLRQGSRISYAPPAFSMETFFWNPQTLKWDFIPGFGLPYSKRRAGASVCYDTDLGQVILYGGYRSELTPTKLVHTWFNDTWTLAREDPGIVVDPPPTAEWCAGGNGILSVAVTGAPGSVQWYRNAEPIPGATSTILLVSPVTAASAGQYQCLVSNGCGSIASGVCMVTVRTPPFITVQPPVPQPTCPGGDVVIIGPGVGGSAPMTYELQRQFGEFWETATWAAPLAGSSFAILDAQHAHSGIYRFVATNACGSVATNSFPVQIGVTFSQHPQPTATQPCSNAVLSVTAQGVGPLAFRWRRGGVPLEDDPPRITGAAAATLTIQSMRYEDEGVYTCAVTDSCETRVSNSANLTLPTPQWSLRSTSGPIRRSTSQSDMAYDPVRGVCVLYGGYGPDGYLDDTWEWDGIGWTQKFPAHNPGKRSGQELVFDTIRNKTLLFGGSGVVPANSDVWEYDGNDWTLVTASPGGPPQNAGVQGDAAFDSARGRLVLICENTGSGTIPGNHTWEFDSASATWQLASSGLGPYYHNSPIAFDPWRGYTVGQYYWPTLAWSEARTWATAGSGWAEQVSAQTPPRYYPIMAYDGVRKRATTYGCCRGQGPGQYTTETWGFNGAQWGLILPDIHLTQLDAVIPTGMAFDSKRRAMMMIGSAYNDAFNAPVQTWEFRYLDRVLIDREPQDQPLLAGGSAVFSVKAAGTGTLAYQWRKNGTALANGPTPGGSAIAGASSATLTISGLVQGDAGAYSCAVSNACGSVVSAPADLGSVCYPDCNAGGSLTVADFGCFQTKYALGDPYADCNASGALSIADFGCFQTKYALGCP